MAEDLFWRPRGRNQRFFFAPGGLQERSGADFYSAHVASWQPPGARGIPGGLRELILGYFGSLFASILAPSLGHLASRFGLRRGPPGGEKTTVFRDVRPPGALEKNTAATNLGNTNNNEPANKSKSQQVQITQKTKSSPNKFSRSAWLRKGGRRCWRSHSQ